jgi:L-ascorbate metabolism protein UlaG (beta-lactamase superfamily)
VELQYFGANCVRLSGRKFNIMADDNLAQLGLKAVIKPADISLRTSQAIPPPKEAVFSADMPGEYEIAGAIIHGVAARAHMDEEAKHTATIFTVEAEDTKVALIGHIYPNLSDEQLEQIGTVDVLIIPVGGNGFTLDGAGALEVIKKIEPKVVIPTHYADKAIKYEVAQAEALKNMGMEPAETVAKYKIRPGELSDSTKLVVLERQ